MTDGRSTGSVKVQSNGVDDVPGMNVAALAAWLDNSKPGMLNGRLRAELILGGRSNLTYLIADDEASWVLRRPPLGHVLATAHDMAREFRVTAALAQTVVPVAKPLILCEDPEVLGAPFYVMERVDGLVLHNSEEAFTIGPSKIPALSYRLVGVLGELHATDPASIGLADFGRADGFLDRQIGRWTKQLNSSHSRLIPGLDELAKRLRKNIPTSQRAAIVHGDFRLDNAIVSRTADDTYDVAAIVDWEMSTLGDPLTDIGLFCVYWAAMGSDVIVPTNAYDDANAPFPPTADLVSTYADASGLDLDPLPWYVAFGAFKLAVIVEGIHYRHTLGKTVGTGFSGIGELVYPLVTRGLRSLHEAGM